MALRAADGLAAVHLVDLRDIVMRGIATNHIDAYWLPRGVHHRHSSAIPEERVVVISRDLDDEAAALAALHEIGHVVRPCPGFPLHHPELRPCAQRVEGLDAEPEFTRRRVECERARWAWVRWVLETVWTPSMETIATNALHTYLAPRQSRHDVC